MAIPLEKKRKKLLLITSSGGGGHLQAAKAQAVKALSEDPTTEIIQKDILIDIVSKQFGKGFVFLWNSSQKRGNVRFLMFLLKKSYLLMINHNIFENNILQYFFFHI